MKIIVLCYFFEEIGLLQIVKIEFIQVKFFDLINEYWISFIYKGYMYDKKYVFVKGSIQENNFIIIFFINFKGVMI